MVYTQFTMSPATIEYARSLGATGFHIGVLGALPAAMLFMQFLAAIVANHIRHRRWLWMSVSIVQRLILVPLALGPVLLAGVNDAVWVWGLIVATALNHALLHFCTPLWLSWMGDYLPHKGLNRFWGVRHLWMQWAAAISLLAGAFFFLQFASDIRVGFAIMIGIGAVFGVADLLLFLRIEEPAVTPAPEPQLRKVLTAPFRERGFRSFIAYACFWHFAAMIGAPFISYYLLSYVGMDLFRLLMLWTMSWVGGAILSRHLGKLAETFGNRPVLILCTVFKSANMIALLLVPRDPTVAFWILVPVFMLDALMNAGIAIANNGFMLKNSPAENRTMYIAAGTALAGMVGGITSVAAGAGLTLMATWEATFAGVTLGNFHVLFAFSLVMRWVSVVFAVRVHEPASRGTSEVVTLLIGATPMRILRFPVGLYRSMRNGGVDGDSLVDRSPIDVVGTALGEREVLAKAPGRAG